MEKSCKTCKYCLHNGLCKWLSINNCCVNLNKYEAKMEKIQMTEEQARELLGSLVQISEKHQYLFNIVGHKETLSEWKELGYIIKNPVEEAEEMYNHIMNDSGWSMHSIYNDTILCQHEAIIYLQEEIKKLRGE